MNSSERTRLMRRLSMLFSSWLCFYCLVTIAEALQMPPPPRCDRHTSSFGAKQNHPTTYNDAPAYLGPIVLPEDSRGTSENHVRIRNWYERLLQKEENDDNDHAFIKDLLTISPELENNDPSNFDRLMKGSTKTILTKIVYHFARMDAPVDVKEVCESVEFVMRMRKRVVGHVIKLKKQSKKEQPPPPNTGQETIYLQDLCCGHGLTGMLFAACYGGPQKVCVTLVDQKQPLSHKILKDLLVQVCPWVKNQITYQASSLDDFMNHSDDELNKATPNIVIATHACGSLTDYVIDYAIQKKAESIAVMPCCYTGTDVGSPYGVKRALGVSWAADIKRSYKLQERGYHVDFGAIPLSITPMNRIIVGELR